MTLGEGKWKNAGGGMQLFLLLALWYFGVILSGSFAYLLYGDEAYSTADNVRIVNTISGIFLFLIPATIYSLLFADTKGTYLTKQPIKIFTLLLAIVAIFCIQPFVETVNHYNELITLPKSMASLQEFFQEAKESGEKVFKLIFEDKSISSLLINILVIAIVPGIVEELFFRGCMQRSISKIGGNIHVAIWITAIIFSLLHFQLDGLFPRILLGAMLGYLYAWTSNIWIPIIVHAIHNATIVIIQQMLIDTAFYKKIAITDYSLSNAGVIALISLILTSLVLFVIQRNKIVKQNS